MNGFTDRPLRASLFVHNRRKPVELITMLFIERRKRMPQARHGNEVIRKRDAPVERLCMKARVDLGQQWCERNRGFEVHR